MGSTASPFISTRSVEGGGTLDGPPPGTAKVRAGGIVSVVEMIGDNWKVKEDAH